MLRFKLSSCVAVAAFAALASAGAQQSGVTLSPFVTFLPTGAASPMAGLALAIAGGPLALRAGGHISLQERSSLATAAGVTTRPWGADVDALAYLDGYSYGDRIAFAPYVMLGVSTSAVDTGSLRVNRQGWSYGGGVTIPVGGTLGLFSEARWRMSQFILPNAQNAPDAAREFRVGVAVRVGGGGAGLGDLLHVISSADEVLASEGSTTGNSSASRLLSTAASYLGAPYRRGGASPSSGFDASGFVRFIFSRFGITLPRTSRDQARIGERVRPDWRVVSPGDLVMFEDEGGINHVAIYVGKSRIIHSSETGGGVRYDDLLTDRGRWFYDHLVAARRVPLESRGALLDLARGFATEVASNTDGPDHAPRAATKRR